MRVPVAVTALDGAALARYNTSDLTALGTQIPDLVINKSSSGSGGSITLRGIGTVANQAGFEQAVSVNIDGVQTSRGNIVSQGFFDLKQVEVLKGPQALFFGKNSPAGVISLISANPSDHFEASLKTGYEFKADEVYTEAVISGPLSDTLGARLAVRGDDLKGWMHNDAVSESYPFNTPGTNDKRPGEREAIGRLTLEYKPDPNFTAVLKVFGSISGNDGPSAENLQVTSCGTGTAPDLSIAGFNLTDPTGDCRGNSRTSNGDLPAYIVANWKIADKHEGHDFGLAKTIFSSLNMDWHLGDLTLTSTSGYNGNLSEFLDDFDGTTYDQAASMERDKFRSISQQFRIESEFSSGLNFMVGGFYSNDHHNFLDISRIAPLPVDPATGKYQSWERPSHTNGQTISAFGQLRYIFGNFEIDGGGRFTHETKDSSLQNTYVAPDLLTVFSKALFTDHFKGNNFSPEATASWHPTTSSTIYVAYKTGYKSGGFALNTIPTFATTTDDLKFGSEKVKGEEVGAKAQLLDHHLTAEFTAYHYHFTNLQVNSFDPATLSFSIENAASVQQFGVEGQLSYTITPSLVLRTAVNYNHNRFGHYITQCYSGQTLAEGCAADGQDLSGTPTRASPDWSGNGGFTYERDLHGMTFGFTGDAYYSGGYWESETHSPFAYQNSFWKFDASTRVEFDKARYEIALIGRNLTNKYNVLFASDKPFSDTGQQYGTVARPREIVLQGTVHF